MEKLFWGLHKNKICDLCSTEIKILDHFLIEWSKLLTDRQQCVELQRQTNLNYKNEILAIILLLKICTDQLDIYYLGN